MLDSLKQCSNTGTSETKCKQNFIQYLIYFILILFAFRLPIKLPTFETNEFSWMLALSYASINDLIWGKDILFTYGPWHMVTTRLYNPEFHYILILSQTYVWLAFGWFFLPYYFESRTKKKILIILFAILSFAFLYLLEMFFMVIGYILFSKAISAKNIDRILTCILLLLSGMFTLSKLSLLPLYLGLMILADIYALIIQRRIPIYSICVSLSFFIFWLLSGHKASQLMPYMVNVNPIIDGYSVAMQYPPMIALSLIITVSIMIPIIMIFIKEKFNELKSNHSNFIALLGSGIIFFAISLLCFLLIKSGYTRYDPFHAQLTLSAILILIVIFTLDIPIIKNLFNFRKVINSILVLLLIYIILKNTFFSLQLIPYKSELGSFSTVYLFSPQELNQKHNDHWQSLNVEARKYLKDLPIGEITGHVDVYPINIISAITANLQYNPRPTIVSYSAYSSELQKANLSNLTEGSVPQHLFYKTFPIDGRLESLLLGPSLLEILSSYEVKDTNEQIGLLLERKAKPYNKVRTGYNTIKVNDIFNETINIPIEDNKDFIIMTVDMQLSAMGKILKTLLKGPRVNIDLIKEDNIETRLFIPNAANEGFLISPQLSSTEDTQQSFEDIKYGNTLHNHNLKQVRFHIHKDDKFFKWAYEKNAVITFTSYKLTK